MTPIDHNIEKGRCAEVFQSGTKQSEMAIPLFEFSDISHADKRSDCAKKENVGKKLLDRKLMNRASAAISRERKRKYVQSLEGQVVELENIVNQLEVENASLKAESHLMSLLFEDKSIMLDNAMLDYPQS